MKWHKADADEKWLPVLLTRSLDVNMSKKQCCLCCRKRQRLWEKWTVPWVSWGFRWSIMWYFTVIQQEHVPASCFCETGLWKTRKWRFSTYSSVVVLWGEGAVSDLLAVILHISTLDVLPTGPLHVLIVPPATDTNCGEILLLSFCGHMNMFISSFPMLALLCHSWFQVMTSPPVAVEQTGKK